MSFIPPKKNLSLHISLALLILGFVLFSLSGYIGAYRFVFQIASIALLTLGIQTLQRYQLSQFTYVIDDKDNGECLFTVIKTQGKKSVTVCSVNLCDCICYDKLDDYKGKPANSYDYRQNPFSGNNFALIYRETSGDIAIRLEPDETFVSAIKSRISSKN